MTSIHARTICALAVQQRLLDIVPMVADWFHDQHGTIMGRIHITEEIMADVTNGAFVEAIRAEFDALARDFAVKP